MTTAFPHPYYPLGVELPGYLANESSVLSLVGRFAVCWVTVLGIAFLIINRVRPSASRSDRLAFLWFCLTASIHLFFEAYFVLNHAHVAGARDLFGQLWKEYSLADSRCLTSDTFLVCMEFVTAFCWGPLGLLVAYCIAVQHPVRHALQIIISLGQIYGDVLYYATSMFDLYNNGVHFCRPERYYFWFYYFFMNFIWIVIPSLIPTNSTSLSNYSTTTYMQQQLLLT
ncbi:hypothetical protein T310_9669 [Rasamsonia emersonii CBS 393.64]|uniref:EXPERA domain-containing protein n=1 Tax=Rasamsonia emersonii (strain ATCC 16479 / CBS 393.64 / IMI 116815) TaxID=1408163 RepID=A0A0F4YEZ9_RASE3|nr:hypothetical protein T310_9669 [Rasamsonia emersonii CBS 393.64]KKA16715.1 hypothetical protein T310_9669 [Rasamsonia emersonii CBS 393.64]